MLQRRDPQQIPNMHGSGPIFARFDNDRRFKWMIFGPTSSTQDLGLGGPGAAALNTL